MRKLFSLLAALAIGNSAFPAFAEDWGTLKGQILLNGEIPKVELLVTKGDQTAKDAAVCAAQDVPKETLVVDPKTKGIANVVVYLQKKPEKIHPDLVASKNKEVTFDQKGCRFLPHIMVVRTDQQVRVLSDDDVAHNTHTYTTKTTGENIVIPPKDRKGLLMKPFKAPEKVPSRISCDIHSFMEAYWVVVDHPYAAVTDAEGNFEIPNLPAGSHEFTVWQEKVGYLDRKYTVTIKAGMNEQKPLKYTPEQLMK